MKVESANQFNLFDGIDDPKKAKLQAVKAVKDCANQIMSSDGMLTERTAQELMGKVHNAEKYLTPDEMENLLKEISDTLNYNGNNVQFKKGTYKTSGGEYFILKLARGSENYITEFINPRVGNPGTKKVKDEVKDTSTPTDKFTPPKNNKYKTLTEEINPNNGLKFPTPTKK